MLFFQVLAKLGGLYIVARCWLYAGDVSATLLVCCEDAFDMCRAYLEVLRACVGHASGMCWAGVVYICFEHNLDMLWGPIVHA